MKRDNINQRSDIFIHSFRVGKYQVLTLLGSIVLPKYLQYYTMTSIGEPSSYILHIYLVFSAFICPGGFVSWTRWWQRGRLQVYFSCSLDFCIFRWSPEQMGQSGSVNSVSTQTASFVKCKCYFIFADVWKIAIHAIFFSITRASLPSPHISHGPPHCPSDVPNFQRGSDPTSVSGQHWTGQKNIYTAVKMEDKHISFRSFSPRPFLELTQLTPRY